MAKVFNFVPLMAKLLSIEEYCNEYLIDEFTSKSRLLFYIDSLTSSQVIFLAKRPELTLKALFCRSQQECYELFLPFT